MNPQIKDFNNSALEIQINPSDTIVTIPCTSDKILPEYLHYVLEYVGANDHYTLKFDDATYRNLEAFKNNFKAQV